MESILKYKEILDEDFLNVKRRQFASLVKGAGWDTIDLKVFFPTLLEQNHDNLEIIDYDLPYDSEDNNEPYQNPIAELESILATVGSEICPASAPTMSSLCSLIQPTQSSSAPAATCNSSIFTSSAMPTEPTSVSTMPPPPPPPPPRPPVNQPLLATPQQFSNAVVPISPVTNDGLFANMQQPPPPVAQFQPHPPVFPGHQEQQQLFPMPMAPLSNRNNF